jgi:hypothetical protein
MAIEYYKGAELPNVDITWLDSNGDPVNFSSGYTFTVKIGTAGSAATVTKTSGITGTATAPNIVIAWDAAELDSLNPGTYDMDIIARETATSKDRIRSTDITILAAVV